MLKRVLKLALIGFVIGIFIGDGIALLTGMSSDGELHMVTQKLLDMAGGNAIGAIILQSLFSGLYGAVCFAGIMLHDIDRMPLTAAAVTHCLAIVIAFYPMAFFLGWTNDVFSALIMSGMQIVAYFIIWLVLYIHYKSQVKKLNEQLRQKNKQTEGE